MIPTAALVIGAVLFQEPSAPVWHKDLESAAAAARKQDRLVCALVLAKNEASVATAKAFEDAALAKFLSKYALCRLELGSLEAVRLSAHRAPAILILDPSGRPRVEQPLSEADQRNRGKLDAGQFRFEWTNRTVGGIVEFLRDASGCNFSLDPRIARQVLSYSAEDVSILTVLAEVLKAAGATIRFRNGFVAVIPAPPSQLERYAILDGSRSPTLCPGYLAPCLSQKISLNYDGDGAGNFVSLLNEYVAGEMSPFVSDLSLADDARITLRAQGLTIEQILNELQDEGQLTWTVGDDRVSLSSCDGGPALEPLRIAEFLGRHAIVHEWELPAEARDAIRRSIEELGDDSAVVRERASESLQSRISEARGMLRTALKACTDPEIRARLLALLQP